MQCSESVILMQVPILQTEIDLGRREGSIERIESVGRVNRCPDNDVINLPSQAELPSLESNACT